MRIVSHKIVEKIRNTRFVFNNVFPKIVRLMEKCRKKLYSRAGHRWQYDACAMQADT